MSIVIFGSGAMSCEPQFPVMAPGARTWQVLQVVAGALPPGKQIVVVGLEQKERPGRVTMQVSVGGRSALYIPLTAEALGHLASNNWSGCADAELSAATAVIGCASLLPCNIASHFADAKNLPLWVDIFGDPLCETQSQVELHAGEADANSDKIMHVWRLYLRALLRGDRFSALSRRQRFAVIGQLGAAGRLNKETAAGNMVDYLPFGLVQEDAKEALPFPPVGATINLLWSGSFNTWTDVDTLTAGFVEALRQHPRLRLVVVGGLVSNYSELSYQRFVQLLKEGNVSGSVQLLDWQPLEQMQKLYASCHAGINIDRFTYEAVLGSRTRIVNFLAAGRPVVTTTLTELTSELEAAGLVIPFAAGDAMDLARALGEVVRRADDLAQLGKRGRAFVLDQYSPAKWGRGLGEWVQSPMRAADALSESANPLTGYWHKVLASTQS